MPSRSPIVVSVLSLVVLGPAAQALAGDWTRWPLRQLIESALEQSCESLATSDPSSFSYLAHVLADRYPNSPDALALSASLIAEDAIRPDGATDLKTARERIVLAEKLGPGRPLVAFARGNLALAEARHALRADERRAALARADRELASVVTASGTVGFYARAARVAVAAEAADLDALRLRQSEALVALQAAHLGADFEHRLHASYERHLGDLGAARDVLRESLWLERARVPRWGGRAPNRWNDSDENNRSFQKRWTLWALAWSGASAQAVARGHAAPGDAWHGRIEASALRDLGEPRRALAAARRARNAEPGHASDESVAQALVQMGDLAHARPVLLHALAASDADGCSTCTALLARVELLSGDRARGAKLAALARSRDDGSPETLAVLSLEALLEGDHSLSNTLGTRARSRATREEYRSIDRAEDAFKAALRFGRLDEAEEQAALFLAKRPASQRALRLLAEATAKHGDPRAPWLAEKLALPQDAWTHLARGEARLARGDLEAALPDLRRAVALYGATRNGAPREAATEELVRAKRAVAGAEQALRERAR